MLNDLVGTRGAYILDQKLEMLGKVPLTELEATVKGLTGGVYAIVFDGVIDRELIRLAERIDVKYVAAMDSNVKQMETKVNLLTIKEI
jgi:regulator of PEP synthase PpsR (kinase-PPPase family)